MNTRNKSELGLNEDEGRLVRLFRLLGAEQSEVLTEVARRAMNHYSVDSRSLHYSNWRDVLQNELSGGDRENNELLMLRLFRCLPDSNWHPWLDSLENWKDEVFESSWDDILSVLMGSSEFDETNAGMLQDGIATIYNLNRSAVAWEPEDDLKEYPIEKLVDFIRDWRRRILEGLECKVGKANLEKGR